MCQILERLRRPSEKPQAELASLTYKHQTHAQRRGCIHFPSIAKWLWYTKDLKIVAFNLFHDGNRNEIKTNLSMAAILFFSFLTRLA